MMEIHAQIRDELMQLKTDLTPDGGLYPASQLQTFYDAFRKQFSPEVLRALEGQELLERMHAHGSRDSLVYWLEFKNDETFPAIFGSISGGSALKFGVYRRVETGTWATKGPGRDPKDISLSEAIEIARKHRDQILAAVDLVAKVPSAADDETYLQLQRELRKAAPDIEDTAWGHKYLSLIFPDRLDDFHVESYQRYNLIRVLQLPPRDGEDFAVGRYVCAGRFGLLARELDVSLHDLTTLLNRRHGGPRTYWRIGTTDDEKAPKRFWPLMRDRNVVAIGWPDLGDLSGVEDSEESKESIAAKLRRHYPNIAAVISRKAGEILRFTGRIAKRDRVIAADGQTVLGVGEVTGPYSYDPTEAFPHHRPVDWRSLDEWKTPVPEGLRTTVATFKDPLNQLEVERRLLEPVIRGTRKTPPDVVRETRNQRSPLRGPLPRLTGVPALVQAVVERKSQVILYGPPGTGKTHWALHAARDLAALRAFGVAFPDLSAEEKVRVREKQGTAPPLVRLTSFHPEYGYEDFIEGYRPSVSADGALAFALVPGVFRQICADAESSPALDFYLIVDEINRGDVPRIFGELLTLLERDKRGEKVVLPLSGETFQVPPNVFVLGTMNTADRSIALLDVALRRRFGFIELLPDYSFFKSTSIEGLPLGPWLSDLNTRVSRFGGGDGRNRQIGHAFFLNAGSPISSIDQLTAILRDDVVPLLEEYAYDDFSQLSEILGSGLVDVNAQRIRRELFEPGRGAELIAALWRPEVATAPAAIMTDDSAAEDDEDEDSEGNEPRTVGRQSRSSDVHS